MKRYVKANTQSSKLAKFIEDSVHTLLTSDYTNNRYILDDDWAVYVGWSDAGFDVNDDAVIHDKDNPDWVICAKIATTDEYMWSDYDSCNMPYDEESGEVYDTDIGIPPNADSGYYKELADWFIKSYDNIILIGNNDSEEYDEDEDWY